MADKKSGVQTSYQGRGSNARRGLRRVCGNSYSRGHESNLTKPKFREKCKALGSDVYSIGYSRQSYKYTQTTGAILNINFNEGNNVKEALEKLNHFD